MIFIVLRLHSAIRTEKYLRHADFASRFSHRATSNYIILFTTSPQEDNDFTAQLFDDDDSLSSLARHYARAADY